MSSSLHPSTWFYTDAPYVGGAELYLHWHLLAAGPDEMGLIALDLPGLQTWIEELHSRGFAVERLRPGNSRRRLLELRERLLKLSPRVVHFNFPHPYDGIYGLAPWAAKFAAVPRIVVTEHLPSVGRVGKRYWAKRSVTGSVDAAICVCEAHREIMTRDLGYPGNRVITVANGVEDKNPEGKIWARESYPMPADLAAQERGGGPRIVQLGSLDLRKGGDLLIDAAAGLQQQGIDFQLWFVGEGHDRQALEERIAQKGLHYQVHLAGHRSDTTEILRASDLAVLASRREGMPLSLLEAICQGLPVAATAVDGVAEVAIHRVNGLLVPPEDHRMLAWALRELLKDPSLRVRFGGASRRHYEHNHTLDSMTRATFAVHER